MVPCPNYRTSRRVEFRDTDAAGIVHFSVFFTWMETAEHELLRGLGLSVVSKDETGTITWPRVAVRCDYQGPVRFEEMVEIEVQVAKIGSKSVTYDFQFTGPRGARRRGRDDGGLLPHRTGRRLSARSSFPSRSARRWPPTHRADRAQHGDRLAMIGRSRPPDKKAHGLLEGSVGLRVFSGRFRPRRSPALVHDQDAARRRRPLRRTLPAAEGERRHHVRSTITHVDSSPARTGIRSADRHPSCRAGSESWRRSGRPRRSAGRAD